MTWFGVSSTWSRASGAKPGYAWDYQVDLLGYKYYMIDEDFTREELFEKFPTARTFPQITAHGEYIGGFTEFEQWHNGLRRV